MYAHFVHQKEAALLEKQSVVDLMSMQLDQLEHGLETAVKTLGQMKAAVESLADIKGTQARFTGHDQTPSRF